jgi:4'-phosphopantetheinyl transferase EntD
MTLDLRSQLFSGLVSRNVIVCTTELHRVHPPAFDEEEVLISHAVAKRKREFRAGRACAHAALAALGVARAPLLSGPDREPLWPPGIVGSISHSNALCGVAVALRTSVRALGIDIETAEPLALELRARVCTAQELAATLGHSGTLAHKIVFTAKEATYKCLHPIVKMFFGFHAAEITLGTNEFTVELRQDLAPFRMGDRFGGRWRVSDGQIVTALEL